LFSIPRFAGIRTFDSVRRIRGFGGMPSMQARALCGLFLFGSLSGCLAAMLIGLGHRDGSFPLVHRSIDPDIRAEREWKLRRANFPMAVNESVESWTLYFSTRRKSLFEHALSRGGQYSDMIRTGLRKREMPEELIYLALIESDFHTDARSRVLATGMWQFMAPTAKRYGLRIDAYVDERYDPVKATDAALDHLSDLYQRYGSWYLAAAAYNAGATRVSNALRRYTDGRLGDDDLYWEIVDHLPSETANYVPKLLAATRIAQSAEQYDLDVSPEKRFDFDWVWAPGGIDLEQLALSLGIGPDLIYHLNSELIRQTTPPGEIYQLRVPVGMVSQTVAALALPNSGALFADD
jgi:membrane-bound lytic murein transglycosylase D